jgi:hypothetical protein
MSQSQHVRRLCFVFLLLGVAAGLGCFAGVRSRSAVPFGKEYDEYEHMFKAGRRANNGGSVDDVLEYASAVGNLSEATRANVDRQELLDHLLSASALLDRALPGLDAGRRPRALRSQALLAAYMGDGPKAERLLRESMALEPKWATGRTLLWVMRGCWPPSGVCPRRFANRPAAESIDACTKTYQAGKAESIDRDTIIDLLALCVQLSPSDDQIPQTFPAVASEDWAGLRERVRRTAEEIAARRRGPCVFDLRAFAYRHCTVQTGSQCVGWGDACED